MCPVNLSCFIKYGKPSLDVKYNGGNCLHFLMEMLRKHSENSNNISRCMEILLDHTRRYGLLNLPGKNGDTPFFLLMKAHYHEKLKKNIQDLESIVSYIIDNDFHIDFTNYKGAQIRELFVDCYGKHYPFYQILECVKKPVDINDLVFLIRTSSVDQFIVKFKQFKHAKKNWNNPILLSTAVECNSLQIVTFLCDEGISINRAVATKKPPLFLAASEGSIEILDKLLEKNAKTTYGLKTLLHETCEHLRHSIEKDDNYQKCFKSALEKCDYFDVNKKDGLGYTALHYAAFHDNVDAMKALIAKQSFIGSKDSNGRTPLYWMKKLAFEEILDSCVTSKKNKEGLQEFCVNFTFLWDPEQTNIEMNTLKTIAKDPDLKSLIIHPAIHSFVDLKWSRNELAFYHCNLLLLFLLFSLTAHNFVCTLISVLALTLRLVLLFIIRDVSLFSCLSEFGLIILTFLELLPLTLDPFIRVTTTVLTAYKIWRVFSDVPLDIKKHENKIKIVSSTMINLFICYDTLLYGSTSKQNDTFTNNTSIDRKDNSFVYDAVSDAATFIAKTFYGIVGEFSPTKFNYKEYPFFSIIYICYIIFGHLAILNIISAFCTEISVSKMKFRHIFCFLTVFVLAR